MKVGFLVLVPYKINKFLAQYELYKKILEFPSDIFELGVFKGVSLIRLVIFGRALENDNCF